MIFWDTVNAAARLKKRLHLSPSSPGFVSSIFIRRRVMGCHGMSWDVMDVIMTLTNDHHGFVDWWKHLFNACLKGMNIWNLNWIHSAFFCDWKDSNSTSWSRSKKREWKSCYFVLFRVYEYEFRVCMNIIWIWYEYDMQSIKWLWHKYWTLTVTVTTPTYRALHPIRCLKMRSEALTSNFISLHGI